MTAMAVLNSFVTLTAVLSFAVAIASSDEPFSLGKRHLKGGKGDGDLCMLGDLVYYEVEIQLDKVPDACTPEDVEVIGMLVQDCVDAVEEDIPDYENEFMDTKLCPEKTTVKGRRRAQASLRLDDTHRRLGLYSYRGGGTCRRCQPDTIDRRRLKEEEATAELVCDMAGTAETGVSITSKAVKHSLKGLKEMKKTADIVYQDEKYQKELEKMLAKQKEDDPTIDDKIKELLTQGKNGAELLEKDAKDKKDDKKTDTKGIDQKTIDSASPNQLLEAAIAGTEKILVTEKSATDDAKVAESGCVKARYETSLKKLKDILRDTDKAKQSVVGLAYSAQDDYYVVKRYKIAMTRKAYEIMYNVKTQLENQDTGTALAEDMLKLTQEKIKMVEKLIKDTDKDDTETLDELKLELETLKEEEDLMQENLKLTKDIAVQEAKYKQAVAFATLDIEATNTVDDWFKAFVDLLEIALPKLLLDEYKIKQGRGNNGGCFSEPPTVKVSIKEVKDESQYAQVECE